MTTASMPASEFSLCQTKRDYCPRKSLSKWRASWSKLEAGNCRTAKFISLDFELVIFDHRVAQNFMASLVDLFAPAFLVNARQIDFQILADMHGADALIAHLFEGVLDGFPLRIKDGL